jgi:hypothetical protein
MLAGTLLIGEIERQLACEIAKAEIIFMEIIFCAATLVEAWSDGTSGNPFRKREQVMFAARHFA